MESGRENSKTTIENKISEKPQATIIIHVEQLHEPTTSAKRDDVPSKRMLKEDFENVAFSQFNVAKTIIANPNAIVLNENQNSDITRKDYTYRGPICGGFNDEIIKKIKKDFPKGFPNTYDDLTSTQKEWLVSRRAPLILFSLDIINEIYKTDTRDEAAKMLKELKSKNFLGTFSRIYRLVMFGDAEGDPKIKQIIIDDRENRALRLADEAKENCGLKNPIVLLIYGSGHDFGKRIKEENESHPHRIYEGRVITTNEVEIKSSDKILPSGVLITPGHNSILIEEFSNILNAYRTDYKSTSLFKTGIRSSAMKALFAFLDTSKKNNVKEITYSQIHDVLTKADAGLIAKTEKKRTQLFRNGFYFRGEKINTATDKIILDLRNSFQAPTLQKTSQLTASKNQ